MRKGIYNIISPLLQGDHAGMAQTAFGRDWLAAKNRIGEANALARAAGAGIAPLQNKVIGAANNISAAAGRLPGFADKIAAMTAGYAPYQKKISNTADQINALTDRLPGYADKINGATGLLSDYAREMAALARTGKIAPAMTDAMNASVARAMNQSIGQNLNDLAARGVLNSTVTNRGLQNINDAAADAYSKNYLNAYNAALNAWQGAAGAQNQVIGGYRNAQGAINDTIAGKNAAIGGQKAAMDALTQAINGYGTAANAVSQNIAAQNAALGGYNSALTAQRGLMQDYLNMPKQIIDSATALYSPAYSFWKDLQHSYDSKEDYDTIVKQGK